MKNTDKAAVNSSTIRSVSLTEGYKSDRYEVLHRKGDKYKKFDWHLMKKVEVEYTDTLFWLKYCASSVSEKEILENERYEIKDGEVYVKPCITIYYIDGKYREKYYDTYEAALKVYNRLVKQNYLTEI